MTVVDFPPLPPDELAAIEEKHRRNYTPSGRVRSQRAAARETDRAARLEHQAAEDDRAELAERQRSARVLSGAPRMGDEGAGFLLGLFAWTIALNYLRGGLPQAKGWIAAKFINKPYEGGTAMAPLRPSRPAQPGRPG